MIGIGSKQLVALLIDGNWITRIGIEALGCEMLKTPRLRNQRTSQAGRDIPLADDLREIRYRARTPCNANIRMFSQGKQCVRNDAHAE